MYPYNLRAFPPRGSQLLSAYFNGVSMILYSELIYLPSGIPSSEYRLLIILSHLHRVTTLFIFIRRCLSLSGKFSLTFLYVFVLSLPLLRKVEFILRFSVRILRFFHPAACITRSVL